MMNRQVPDEVKASTFKGFTQQVEGAAGTRRDNSITRLEKEKTPDVFPLGSSLIGYQIAIHRILPQKMSQSSSIPISEILQFFHPSTHFGIDPVEET